MIVNEEGLLKDLPLNRAGSLLYGTQFHGSPSWETSSSWPRNGCGGRDIVGIPEDRAEKVAQELIKAFKLKGAEQ